MQTVGDFKLHGFVCLKICSGAGSPLIPARYVLAVVLELVGMVVRLALQLPKHLHCGFRCLTFRPAMKNVRFLSSVIRGVVFLAIVHEWQQWQS